MEHRSGLVVQGCMMVLTLLASLLLVAVEAPAETAVPVRTVIARLLPDAPAPPATPRVWLTVENHGTVTVRLIRPRQKMIDLYGSWGGWTVTVTGPLGRMEPLPLPGVVVPPTPADCIELRPGESVGVRVDIGGWVRTGLASGENPVRLSDSPGQFALAAEYATPDIAVLRLHPGTGPETSEAFLTRIVDLRSELVSITVSRRVADLGVPGVDGLTTGLPVAARWVEVSEIGREIVNSKQQIELPEHLMARVFQPGPPGLRADWQQAIAADIRPAADARPVPPELGDKGLLRPQRDAKPRAVVLRFSDTRVVVAVLRPVGSYLWHHYHDCLAVLGVARTPAVDALLGIDALAATYGAVFKGVRQGDSTAAVTQVLGEPDATIFTQARGFFTAYFFADDIVITFLADRVLRIERGVPSEVKAEASTRGKRWAR